MLAALVLSGDSENYRSVLADYTRFSSASSTEVSPSVVRQRGQALQGLLKRLDAISVDQLTGDEAEHVPFLRRRLAQEVAVNREGGDFWLVDPFEGVHLKPLNLARATKLADTDYLVRLKRLPIQVDYWKSAVAEGLARSFVPDRRLTERVIAQCRLLADPSVPSPFAACAERSDSGLRQAVTKAIADNVLPAYRAYADFLTQSVLPRAKATGHITPGLYHAQCERTLGYVESPAVLANLGEQTSRELYAQLSDFAKRNGHPSLREWIHALEHDAAQLPNSGEALLTRYRRHQLDAEAKSERFFGKIKPHKVRIVAATDDAEGGATAQYLWDGKDAYTISVDTSDLPHRWFFRVETVCVHEGAFGHDLQAAFLAESPHLPWFRKTGWTAFSEGWALYGESLAAEAGLTKDVSCEVGRLASALLRAGRLRIDVGIHAEGWTREQARKWMRDRTVEDDASIEREVDRVIAMPGQGIAYTLGALRFTKWRQKARATLGDRYDDPTFHRYVLGAGMLPLDLFDARMAEWLTKAAR